MRRLERSLQTTDLLPSHVAIERDRVLVGDEFSSADGEAVHGAARLYDTRGTLLRTFTSPANQTTGYSDYFGQSAALDGGQALIGASQQASGAAYLLDTDPGALLKTFANPRPRRSFNFGTNVKLEGNYAVVSGSVRRKSGTPLEVIDIFHSGTGELLRSLRNPDPKWVQAFGRAPSASDGRLLVGAGQQVFDKPPSQNAFLYNLDTGTLLRSFTDPDTRVEQRAGPTFGFAVSLYDDQALIGAPLNNVAGVGLAGQGLPLRLWQRAPLQSLLNPFPTGQDGFGEGLALGDAGAIVGAYFAGDGNAAAYLYPRDTTPVPVPAGFLFLASSMAVLAVARRLARA